MTDTATALSRNSSLIPTITRPEFLASNTFISKYKPYFISDFYVDNNLLSVLNKLLEIDYLNILLIGSSSSGKTSLLYAIIREYYNLSKDDNLPENNILFVNNLKEQGIQYFRNEMKTFCQTHTAIHGKKKLVIIDDIDNINEQSQQVFRNYIDKYKNNVNFISVCNNIQKVIESIQSRVHIIQLESPQETHFNKLLEKIIVNENIDISSDIQNYILTISNQSIRNLINYLDQR
jgi:DNA polymerase III delta prime subunit